MFDQSTTLREIAFTVCTLFDSYGKTIILTGGSAATIYAPEVYQSRDLDFVMQFASTDPRLINELTNLGYELAPGSTYSNPNTPFTIDFIRENLAIGEAQITKWATIEEDRQKLHVLTPEDCICDRLASYIYWNDLSALKAAAAVLGATNADIGYIESWVANESGDTKETLDRLQSLAKQN